MNTNFQVIKPFLKLFIFSLLLGGSQIASAACAAGSVSLKAPLFIVTVDANRMLTYHQQIGTVAKKAVLKADCVGYTTYTISDTKNLAYPNGTQLVLLGKNDFNSPTPAAIFFNINNGSMDKTVTASGAAIGINSDPFSIYSGPSMVMRVKQPWK
jgi:hypothetical protein